MRARVEYDEAAPPPIAHAAPDVELAEAQLAVGRPDPAAESPYGTLEEDGAVEFEDGLGEREAVGRPEDEQVARPDDEPVARAGDETVARATDEVVARSEEIAPPAHGAGVERTPNLVSRLIAFLQGSWRELQRVQWPDRRQVMQATGVVIGFVIVAGVFLGVADTVASQIVKVILK